jgi:hypothetical protein
MEEVKTDASDQVEVYPLGVFLSRRKAQEFITECKIGGGHNRMLYYSDAPVRDADENTYLELQRALSRVEHRLGKTRKALKRAKEVINVLVETSTNDCFDLIPLPQVSDQTAIMAAPEYAHAWTEPNHGDD